MSTKVLVDYLGDDNPYGEPQRETRWIITFEKPDKTIRQVAATDTKYPNVVRTIALRNKRSGETIKSIVLQERFVRYTEWKETQHHE